VSFFSPSSVLTILRKLVHSVRRENPRTTFARHWGLKLLPVLLAACERSGSSGGERGSRAIADTVRGDSAALASLPPGLVAAFAVREVLTAEAFRDTAAVQCERLGPPSDRQARRRLRARLADSSRNVLFVRATAGDTIRRVELVRREPRGGQRGFIWDAENDAVESIEWRPGVRRPEVSTLPRGGSAGRALRALGRRLLALPCERRLPPPPPQGTVGRVSARPTPTPPDA
jgi:hypothetical protein